MVVDGPAGGNLSFFSFSSLAGQRSDLLPQCITGPKCADVKKGVKAADSVMNNAENWEELVKLLLTTNYGCQIIWAAMASYRADRR